MTHDPNRAMLESYLTALVDGGDFARFLAPDVTWTTMEDGTVVRGREAVRDFITAVHTVAFDARPELGELHVAGDSATLEAVFVGTHTGDFAGVAATGRRVRLPYCVVYRLADGAIAELRAYLSVAALVAQLTGTPAGVSGSAPA